MLIVFHRIKLILFRQSNSGPSNLTAAPIDVCVVLVELSTRLLFRHCAGKELLEPAKRSHTGTSLEEVRRDPVFAFMVIGQFLTLYAVLPCTKFDLPLNTGTITM